MSEFKQKYEQVTASVLSELECALKSIDSNSLEQLATALTTSEQVFFIGVGRVMLSLEAIAKRMSHLGIRAQCVGAITETAITDRDLLIVASGSGTSIVPLAIARKAKSFGAKIIHIGSNPNSEMKEICDFMIRIPVRTRLYLPDEVASCQIMTSLFEQSLLLLGDVLAKMIVDKRNIDLDSLWQFHANLE